MLLYPVRFLCPGRTNTTPFLFIFNIKQLTSFAPVHNPVCWPGRHSGIVFSFAKRSCTRNKCGFHGLFRLPKEGYRHGMLTTFYAFIAQRRKRSCTTGELRCQTGLPRAVYRRVVRIAFIPESVATKTDFTTRKAVTVKLF